MKSLPTGVAVAAAVLIVYLAGLPGRPPSPREPARASGAIALAGSIEPIRPMPASLDLDPRKVALGKRLFEDRRLSRDGQKACASCHRPERGDADDVALTEGLGGRFGRVNVPTVRNSRFNVAQYWDGRTATLEDQVSEPLESPDEMGTTWPAVIAFLNADPQYVREVAAAYGGPVSAALVRDAIATYERSLVSANSRFDDYLRGREDALTERERDGYRLFKTYGCTSCHQGVAVGGNMFQRMGLFGDYFGAGNRQPNAADLGRFNVTGNEADRNFFKVPSLRNVANTAPYFHDGSAATLGAAIAIMARYQLGRDMPADDIDRIAAFLASLSGDSGGPNP